MDQFNRLKWRLFKIIEEFTILRYSFLLGLADSNKIVIYVNISNMKFALCFENNPVNRFEMVTTYTLP